MAGLLAVGSAMMLGAPPAHAQVRGLAMDSSFDQVMTDWSVGAVRSMTRASDGGYLLAANAFTVPGRGGVARGPLRLHEDLTVDAEFASAVGDGFNRPSSSPPVCSAIEDGGGYLVGGSFTSYQGTPAPGGLARLNDDLTLDTEFAAALGEGFGGGLYYDCLVSSVLRSSDGGYIVGGTFTSYQGTPVSGGLARLNDDLTLDDEFATALGEGFAVFGDLFIIEHSRGGYVASGSFTEFQGASVRAPVWLNEDLTLNTTLTDRIFNATPGYVVETRDGGLLFTGRSCNYTTNCMSKLDSDLNMDAEFAAALGSRGFQGSAGIPRGFAAIEHTGGEYLVAMNGSSYQGLSFPTRDYVTRLVPATVAVDPVADQTGVAGYPVDPVQITFRAQGPVSAVTRFSASRLPAGVSIDADTGLITGTPTLSTTTTAQVSVVYGGLQETVTFDWEIRPPAAPILVSETLPAGVVGQPYEHALTTDGDPAPQVHVTTGALPDGLNLDADTGQLSGTPTASGTFAFEVTASNGTEPDAAQDFEVVVTSAPTLVAEDLPPGVVGNPYEHTFVRGGDPAPALRVSAGTLPDGLVLDAATGHLSGTPTASGAFTFDLTATNGTTPSARGSFEILVTAPPNLAPDDPPAGVVGQPYEHTFTTDGDPAPQVHVTSGALPDGLNLDADTGLLSGTPTASGAFTFDLTATNGTTPSARGSFEILVTAPPNLAPD
ncbi:putative Ig domain-containing protein, partial [Cellulomonas triticagri]|uniref:putative Ig domain-containing protein n=1 Tax=Cellulomonas triticagri TaxID=2483352 RepID=UPI0018F4B4B8